MKHDKGQSAIESFSESDISFLARSPDFVITYKNFFDLLGAEIVPTYMDDVHRPTQTPKRPQYQRSILYIQTITLGCAKAPTCGSDCVTLSIYEHNGSPVACGLGALPQF